ncbi:hypothetical protein PsorP6_007500 [Peronosclerospora sorghi]|uniref:Uncharacterized protein n=1 Tax=Peronosclerospora sorghi TaxID=230839 RepID=A0ACC0WAS2_9STRA|nr:hypothetical protein PsorP6_007500 [Peronosclerospora sorghi]
MSKSAFAILRYCFMTWWLPSPREVAAVPKCGYLFTQHFTNRHWCGIQCKAPVFGITLAKWVVVLLSNGVNFPVVLLFAE